MTIEFTMTTKKGIRRTAIIDDCDSDLLEVNWNTRVNNQGYAIYVVRSGGVPRRPISMHRVIMERVLGRELERHEHIDHIDLNGLNNARVNLRIATASQNAANRGAPITNTTGFKGVAKSHNKYRARIQVNGKKKDLGTYETVEEARNAYLEGARRYFGEFARGE